jgi:hypothetical protein
MTRDDITRMAREAGFVGMDARHGALSRFAALVASAEREACIALHGHEDVLAPIGNSAWGDARQDGWIAGTSAYREAIRARGDQAK